MVLVLGQWPAPYRPDPGLQEFRHHDLVVGLALGASVLSPIALLILLSMRWWLGAPWRSLARPAVVYALGAMIWLTVIFFDPGRFAEWYFD